MAEYGRIHADDSRSGGQPVLKPCGHCGEQCADLIIDQGDKWAHYSASCLEVRTGYNLSSDAPWRAEAIAAYNKRQPTQSDALREALWAMPEPYEYLNKDQLKSIRPYVDALRNWKHRYRAVLQEQNK